MVILLLLLINLTFGTEYTLKFFVEKALKNNLELQAEKKKVEASLYEYKTARAYLFPNLKFEETFTRTDISSYVLFTKLSQERITLQDFAPNKLNNPDAVNNFETKITLEIPIWMGGKIRASKEMAKYKYMGDKTILGRKEESVILKVYEAYANAVLAKNAVKVAKQAVKDAQEHVRIAEKAYKTGVALLADVLRAKVYLSKAKEKLKNAENNYKVAKKALELLINEELGDFDVKDFEGCPNIDKGKILYKALKMREDYRAMDYYIKSLENGEKLALSEALPQVFAFASYSMYDKDTPLGSQGSGYMIGAGVKWNFNLGFASFHKKKSFKSKVLSLKSKKKLLEKAILFEIEKAYAEYENALNSLKSAEVRLKEAQEVVRVIEKRYENGLARMVDLLDAQTQLDMARFDYVKALRNCNVSYAKVLFSAGMLKEEVEK